MTKLERNSATQSESEHVTLPKPTRWPIVLALGLSFMATGLVTNSKVSWAGAVLAVAGCIGWFLQVLPYENHEAVPVAPTPVPIATSRRKVARVAAVEVPHRARLPLEIYPISAGIKGGLAGSVAMAALAILYGVLSQRSFWYPVNLLGAVVYEHVQVGSAQMKAFHIELLLVATALHLTTSVLVGLLYGALLPMLPRHPVLLGGILAPVVWTGLVQCARHHQSDLEPANQLGLVPRISGGFRCRRRIRCAPPSTHSDVAVSPRCASWGGS